MRHSINIDNRKFILKIMGELNFEEHITFKNIIRMISESDVKDLSINIDDLTYVDSAGLGMLLLLHEAAKGKNIQPVIEGGNEKNLRLFKLARFDQYFRFE